MHWVYAISLVVVNACGLFLILLGLPGTWLMVGATALLYWWQGDGELLPLWVVLVAAGLALVGELIELVSGAAGTRRAGGTRWGAVGALIGALVGGIAGTILIPVPVVGSLAGLCGGAWLGAVGAEYSLAGRTSEEALRSGQGAAVGRFVGVLAKLAVGVAIWILTGVAVFWPR